MVVNLSTKTSGTKVVNLSTVYKPSGAVTVSTRTSKPSTTSLSSSYKSSTTTAKSATTASTSKVNTTSSSAVKNAQSIISSIASGLVGAERSSYTTVSNINGKTGVDIQYLGEGLVKKLSSAFKPYDQNVANQVAQGIAQSSSGTKHVYYSTQDAQAKQVQQTIAKTTGTQQALQVNEDRTTQEAWKAREQMNQLLKSLGVQPTGNAVYDASIASSIVRHYGDVDTAKLGMSLKNMAYDIIGEYTGSLEGAISIPEGTYAQINDWIDSYANGCLGGTCGADNGILGTIGGALSGLGGLVQAILSLAQNVYDAIKNIPKWIYDNLKPVIDTFTKTVSDLPSKIASAVQTVVDTFTGFIDRIWNTISTTVSGWLTTFTGAIDRVYQWLQDRYNDIKLFITWIKDRFVEIITPYLQKVKDVISDVWEFLKNLPGLIWTQVMNLYNTYIKPVIDTLWEKLNGAYNWAVEKIKEIYNWIYENIIFKAKEILGDWYSKLIKALESIKDAIELGFKGLVEFKPEDMAKLEEMLKSSIPYYDQIIKDFCQMP